MATAVQVEALWNGLTDNSGNPLGAGKVYTYYAGTTTPVSLFTASDKSLSATNPLILDGYGRAQVWADGRYKFVVKTSADVTLYTLDNLLYGFDDSTLLWGALSTGSASAQVVSVPATITAYANGQRVSFIAGYTNTGATTLQLNSLSAVNIVKGPLSVALQAGDIRAGQLVNCTYYGGSFRLEEYPTVSDVQKSRAQLASSVSGGTTITASLTPALDAYETGLLVRFKAVADNSGAATLNLNGLGAKAIQYNGAALVSGDIKTNNWVQLVYDGTQFQLLNPANAAATCWGGTSAGTSTAYTINASPSITAYAAGQTFLFIAHTANGATPTLAVSGVVPAKTIQYKGSALVSGEIQANQFVEVVYDGTNFQIINDPGTGAARLSTASVAQLQDGGAIWGGTSSGTNAITFSTTPSFTAYAAGQVFRFLAGGTPTGATTVQINGIASPKTLQRGGTALAGNEFKTGDLVEIVYDGTNFQLSNIVPAPLFIDRTNNRVGVGLTNPAGTVEVAGTDTNVRFSRYVADANCAAMLFIKSRGATVGTNTIVQNGDQLGRIDFYGANGSGTTPAASIIAGVDGTPGASNDMPGYLEFYTTADGAGSLSSRMKILSNGKVGINESSPTTIFAAKDAPTAGGDVAGFWVTNSNLGARACTFYKFDNNTTTSNVFVGFVVNNGVNASGQINANGAGQAAFGSWSDQRLKENISELPSQLANIFGLRPVEFDYKDGSGHQIGFIAQEVREIYPDLVGEGTDGFLTLSGLGKNEARMIKAFQEFAQQVEAKLAAIQNLNAKVEALEARIVELEGA